MNRLNTLLREARLQFRAQRVKRRLKAEAITSTADLITQLRQEVAELRDEIDELRADSRRVAELRILVEDQLLRRD
ncbi:hypothetical protein ACXR2T_09235 [Leucobacter sp. HY1910]